VLDAIAKTKQIDNMQVSKKIQNLIV
jgi:hypothetical protein